MIESATIHVAITKTLIIIQVLSFGSSTIDGVCSVMSP